MRVLVQDCTTFEYWLGHHYWTKQKKDAFDFKKSTNAIELCVRENLSNAQVVLTFGDDHNLDIALPMARAASAESLISAPKRLSAA